MGNEKSDNLNRKLLRTLLWSMAVTLLLTIILSWVFYAGEYRFFNHYISYLGGLEVYETTILNETSRYIFATGVWLCSLFSLIMAIIYLQKKNWTKLNIIKGIFLLIMVAGGICIGIPYDQEGFRTAHSVGASTFYLAFDVYVFFCQFTRLKRRKISFETGEGRKLTWDKTFVIIMLGITAAYFIFFVAKMFAPTFDEQQVLRMGMVIVQKLIVLCFLIGITMLNLDDY